MVLSLPGMNEVTVKELEIATGSASSLAVDVYYPPGFSAAATALPAVVLVTGHRDSVMEAAVGCKLKDTEQYRTWCRLLSVTGLVAVAYANQQPEADSFTVLQHLSVNAASLGIDADRLGVWACSANVPNALGLIMARRFRIRCAAFLYGYMLDRGGHSIVADAAPQAGFAAPNSSRSIDDLPAELALRILRAGADQFPGINQTIDDFCADALARNMDLTLENHPNAPHSFDILDDSARTRQLIEDTLVFFSRSLATGGI